MIPGTYNIQTAANQTFSVTFAISGITTTTGYSARMDVRNSPSDTSTLLKTLTNGSGLTLSSDGSSLTVVAVISETDIDTMAASLGGQAGNYSLKITAPDATTRQYLAGSFVIVSTPTP